MPIQAAALVLEDGYHGAHAGVKVGSTLFYQYIPNSKPKSEHTLNPSHPNQIITDPKNTNVALCGFDRDVFGPSLLRFPRTKAYASAVHPEAICTGPPLA